MSKTSTSMQERLAAAEARKAAAGEWGFGDPDIVAAQRAKGPGHQLRAKDARHMIPRGLTMQREITLPAKELRASLVEKDGKEFHYVYGHASIVDTPYEMWDWYGPYDEIVEAGAFDVTLGNSPDVAFLVNHRGVTMARTTTGTLKLSTDPDLAVEAWLNPTRQDVRDIVAAIEDGDVDQMSFAFRIAQNGAWWSDDFMTFKITEVDLDRGDVSAVNYGANPYTDIAARQHAIMAAVERLPAAAQRAVAAGVQRRYASVESAALDLAGVHVRGTSGLTINLDELPADTTVTTTGTGGGRSLVDIEALSADVERRAAASAEPASSNGRQGRSIATIQAMLAGEE